MTGAGFDRFEPFRFRRERELDAAGARALYASYSYVRALPAVRRERLLDAIADLVDTRFGGRARNVVLTALYLATRSEEHTSELQSLMRISYAVFCLKKKIKTTVKTQ